MAQTQPAIFIGGQPFTVVGILSGVLLFGAMYYVVPNRRQWLREVWPGALSEALLPGWNELTRLQTRFLGDPQRAGKVLAAAKEGPITADEANRLGLATAHADDIDFEDELRVAIEERASLSPDALTGMEQNYRVAGPETLATKSFGRLSAWQNWIFQRPNAVGEKGALTLYGKPERARFNWTRT